jgi:hypothetical protein
LVVDDAESIGIAADYSPFELGLLTAHNPANPRPETRILLLGGLPAVLRERLWSTHEHEHNYRD